MKFIRFNEFEMFVNQSQLVRLMILLLISRILNGLKTLLCKVCTADKFSKLGS